MGAGPCRQPAPRSARDKSTSVPRSGPRLESIAAQQLTSTETLSTGAVGTVLLVYGIELRNPKCVLFNFGRSQAQGQIRMVLRELVEAAADIAAVLMDNERG